MRIKSKTVHGTPSKSERIPLIRENPSTAKEISEEIMCNLSTSYQIPANPRKSLETLRRQILGNFQEVSDPRKSERHQATPSQPLQIPAILRKSSQICTSPRKSLEIVLNPSKSMEILPNPSKSRKSVKIRAHPRKCQRKSCAISAHPIKSQPTLANPWKP